jgi:hypothetical protein
MTAEIDEEGFYEQLEREGFSKVEVELLRLLDEADRKLDELSSRPGDPDFDRHMRVSAFIHGAIINLQSRKPEPDFDTEAFIAATDDLSTREIEVLRKLREAKEAVQAGLGELGRTEFDPVLGRTRLDFVCILGLLEAARRELANPTPRQR